MDTTFKIAIVGMVSGIFAPVLLAIVQGLFSLKESKMRVAYDKKAPIYQNFAELYGVFYKHADKESKQAFVSAAWAAVLVCDCKSRKLILDLLSAFEDLNDVTDKRLDAQFSECLESLNRDLQKTLSLLPVLVRH